MRISRTPQERKILSYLYDRRNMYGESRTSAIKSIRKRKAMVNRHYRRTVAQQVEAHRIRDAVEEIVPATAGVRRKSWKKVADRPLIEYIETRLRRRKRNEGLSGERRPSVLRKAAQKRLRQRRMGS